MTDKFHSRQMKKAVQTEKLSKSILRNGILNGEHLSSRILMDETENWLIQKVFKETYPL